MIDQFEILAANEDFVARGRQRFFETKELCLRRKIDWASATGAPNSDLISSVTNDLTRNIKLAGGAERINRSDLFGDNRIPIH